MHQCYDICTCGGCNNVTAIATQRCHALEHDRDRFESGSDSFIALSKQGFTHALGRRFMCRQAQARFRKLVRRAQRNVCECNNVANRDGTRFRCLDVSVVLEPENFAEVNSSSNAVAEPTVIVI